jgi:hypothetical protein
MPKSMSSYEFCEAQISKRPVRISGKHYGMAIIFFTPKIGERNINISSLTCEFLQVIDRGEWGKEEVSYSVEASSSSNRKYREFYFETDCDAYELKFLPPEGLKLGLIQIYFDPSPIDRSSGVEFSNLPGDYQNKPQPPVEDCDDESTEIMHQPQLKPTTYQQTKPVRDTFTIDPAAPSCLFVADSRREQLIFKSLDSSTANFKVVVFDRTYGYPAQFGTPYADIDNELFDEILPGSSLVVDGHLAKSDIYVFASTDLAKINITITELK